MKPARVALALALAGVAALYVAAGTSQPWDFETYYYAASAYRAHLDPYDPIALSSVAGRPVDLPFLYPPITLAPFIALSLLPLSAASLVWLGLKLCFLAGLLTTWRKTLLRGVPGEAVLGVTLFGFNAAVLWDLRTGNVAIVEALLLWAGFLSYVRGRALRSACFISAASVFKIAPVAFLGLLVVVPSPARKRVLAVILGVTLLAALLAAGGPLTLRWVVALAHSIVGERQTGEVNPSALGILDGILGQRHRGLALALFGLYACAIILAALPMLRRLRRRGSPEEWVIVAITLWVLLSPRAMIYSYVLMIVPALSVVQHLITSPRVQVLSYFILMTQGLVRLLPGRPPAALAEGPFLLTLAVFALLVARIGSVESQRSPERQIPPGDAG